MAFSLLSQFHEHPIIFPIATICLLWLAQIIVVRINQERKIRALGGHAAFRYGSPFGLPFIYQAVKAGRTHKDYAFWLNNFLQFGNKSNPYTFESRLLNIRIVQTADEENIKAILATQFSDYGKGKNFNEDFHAFLGDSTLTSDILIRT